MALVTTQIQGSYATFPSRPLSWSKGVKLKQHITSIRMIGRVRSFSVKRNSHSSVGTFIHGHGAKVLKISAFKGSTQNDESRARANGSNISKNSVKVSYVPKESGETQMKSPQANDVPVSCVSETDERIAGSAAIHRLFKKWLNMLRTPTSSEVVDKIFEEEPTSREELLQAQNTIEVKERDEILKAVWSRFIGLDAAIKIPLLMFLPLYLAVNVIYGVQMSKEFTWVLAPLVVASYIKGFQLLGALLFFILKEIAKVSKSLPDYCLVTYGNLKEGVRGHLMKIKNNLDFRELSRKKMKELEERMVEGYLDFVERNWPLLRRMQRLLKKY